MFDIVFAYTHIVVPALSRTNRNDVTGMQWDLGMQPMESRRGRFGMGKGMGSSRVRIWVWDGCGGSYFR